ncbi:MAG: hypothetical protein ABL983_13540, partial [Nitrospira sp.]
MTSTNENRFVFPAWSISLMLHGVVVGVLFIFAAQIKPVLQENLFQWDVALVESTSSDSNTEQLAPVQAPEPLPAKKVFAARTKSVPDAHQPAMTITPSEQKIEQVQPTEEEVEVPQLREEPMEQRIADMAVPAAEPTIEARESTPQLVQEEPVAVASAPVSSSNVALSQETPVQTSLPDH